MPEQLSRLLALNTVRVPFGRTALGGFLPVRFWDQMVKYRTFGSRPGRAGSRWRHPV
jgi:hypothetical protein